MATGEERALRTLHTVRSAVLAVVAFGIVGMSAELLLIGHYADSLQIFPLASAGAALGLIAWAAARPSVAVLRALQFVMLTFIAVGIIGVTVHFLANAELQRGTNPQIAALDLFWTVVETSAPPALAPGVMVQLGLLGLLYTYRHPALGDEPVELTG